MSINASRKIIINGDDLGISEGVNQEIIAAHTQGLLTSASLMVTGEAWEKAVSLAKQHPHLSVGLHLVLVCGKSVLPPQDIPHLVNSHGYLSNSPVVAGLNYQFHPSARSELKAEIRAQLERFRQTGLTLTHVDGHLHLHVHPVVLQILAELAAEYQIKYIRLPYEELSLTPHRFSQKITARIFGQLRNYAKPLLDAHQIKTCDRVYGFLATSGVTEDYLLQLLPRITANLVEIYSHPSTTSSGKLEKSALLSKKVKSKLYSCGFELTNYSQCP